MSVNVHKLRLIVENTDGIEQIRALLRAVHREQAKGGMQTNGGQCICGHAMQYPIPESCRAFDRMAEFVIDFGRETRK